MTVRSRQQSRSGGAVFFLFLLGVILTLGLYFVKTWVQTAKAETTGLEAELNSEQEIVSTLRSELAHLQNPLHRRRETWCRQLQISCQMSHLLIDNV